MDKRVVYREKAQAKLEELNARIDLLKAQMKGEAADAKLALNGQVEVLENVRENLQSRMRRLRTGAEDAWEDAWDEIATGLDHAMDEVEHALEKAGEALEKVH